MAPDAVHYRRLFTREIVWQLAIMAIALPTVTIYGYITDPPNRPWALFGFVAISLVPVCNWVSTWVEPTDGTIVLRYWRRFERRLRLTHDTRVCFRTYFVPPGPSLLLHVRPAGSRRIGGSICLLRNTDKQWAGIDAARIRLLADTLQWHCPTAAPDVISVLRAQAEHLDAGLPLEVSPFGLMLAPGSRTARSADRLPGDASMAAAPGTFSSTTLEILSDAELEVLDGPDAPVATPHLDGLGRSARARAVRTAHRRLLARGLIQSPTGELSAGTGQDGHLGAAVRDDVAVIVRARSAPAIVSVARTTPDGQDLWYAQVHPDVVLLEHVSPDGLHRLVVADAADLGALLVDAVTHPQTTDGSGAALVVTDPLDPSPAALGALARPHMRADVALRRFGDDRTTLTGVLTGPLGAWTFTNPLETSAPLLAHPRSREALLTMLHDVARAAVAAAVAYDAAHPTDEG